LGQLRSELAGRFPKQEKMNAMQAQFHLAPVQEASTVVAQQNLIGYRLTSSDGKHVVMMTSEGFTISRLRPYDRWESLREEAKKLWGEYRPAVEPDRITRVALRYINRLDLPADLRDFRDYLTAPPEVPPRLTQTLRGFLTRIAIPIPRVGASAIVTQQSARVADPSKVSKVSVLLDIDVFKDVDLSPDGNEVWELADQLRDEKNAIFFESITERTEELCS
jgi:uncharacterized protein (TIGR04255 family)